MVFDVKMKQSIVFLIPETEKIMTILLQPDAHHIYLSEDEIY